jgi:hypothetical protein
MQKYLKAVYAAVIAGLGATGAALAAGNNHIGWQAGITIAITTVVAARRRPGESRTPREALSDRVRAWHATRN